MKWKPIGFLKKWMENDDVKPPSEDSGSDSGDSELLPDDGDGFELKAAQNLPGQKGQSHLDHASETKKATSVAGAGSASQPSAARAAVPHRSRGASVWAFQGPVNPQTMQTSGAHRVRSRDVHDMEQALQYRSVMKHPSSTPLTFGEKLHLFSLIHSYLSTNGFSWSLNALQQLVPMLDVTSSSSARDASEELNFHLLISEEARRTSLLFDDESAWRVENLFRPDVPMLSLEASSQAVGGPLELLIEKLVLEEKDTPYTEGKPEFHFTNIFLIMAPLFCCPDVLLTNLTKIFKTIVAQRAGLGDARSEALCRRILALLRSYTILNQVDFTRVTLERLVAFCVSATMIPSSLSSGKKMVDVAAAAAALQSTIQDIVKRGTATTRIGLLSAGGGGGGSSAVGSNTSMPLPKLSGVAILSGILDIEDAEVCRQLCLLSFSLFEALHVRELIHNAWTDSTCLKHLCSNLARFMEFSGNIQLWVTSQIISSSDLETRKTTYRKWIRVCRALYNAQNFEMVSAVLEGLRHQAVQRMKRTVDGIDSEVEREELEGLTKVMDPFDNTLHEIPYNITSPSIPTIAPLLGVIYRAEDNGKTVKYHDGIHAQVINWSKLVQLSKPLFRIMAFQSLKYHFYLLPNVQRYLWEMPGRLQSDRLMDMSMEREPN